MFDIGSLMGGMGGGGGGGGGGGTSGVRTDKGWRPTTYGGPPAQASAMGTNPFTDINAEGQQASGMNSDFFAKLLQALGGLGLLGGGQQSGGSPGGGGFQMPSFQRQPAPQQYDGSGQITSDPNQAYDWDLGAQTGYAPQGGAGEITDEPYVW